MALQLKAGRSFVDQRNSVNTNGYFAVKKAVFNFGGDIIFTCDIWKDEATFLAQLPGGELYGQVLPIINDIQIVMSRTQVGTYLSEVIQDANTAFYSFLMNERPPVEMMNYDDWESDPTQSVPATFEEKL